MIIEGTAEEQLQSLMDESAPYDWDEINPDYAQTAMALAHTLRTEIASERSPWHEPTVYQEAYGGGVYFSWFHGYREMKIFCDGETMAVVVDNYGVIREEQYLGEGMLRDLWDWFWNPAATWTYIWRPPNGKALGR